MSDQEPQVEAVPQEPPTDEAPLKKMAPSSQRTAAPMSRLPERSRRLSAKEAPGPTPSRPVLYQFRAPPQTGTVFNIWYNKWSGGDNEDKYLSKTHAKGRCNIALDSGYTKADRGPDCDYLHRLPTIHDMFQPNVDCFGRDKFSDYRDDMGGVGSFTRQNRTVYVGRITVTDDIEEIVARHFAEWGQIERVRVLNTRGVAFITYCNEANAQFAKEAMAHQSLDHEEVLNVRWATPDPNPMAQAREARRIEEKAAEAIRRALPAEFVAEIEGKDPEARKRRKIESSYGLDGYQAPDEIHFALGANAVNPLGRRGFEQENAQEYTPMAIEQAPPQPEGGIFSSSTIAALSAAKVAVASKPKAAAPSGPLVAYESDDDDDDE
ncbi:unnamed protein product [Parascedosporium putredinis]|uniref:Pre-mRNA-splicing factor CWC2 n=1 Tax=Parascedosporium putredinis TaxID=1442378 RepID=A0A9P1H0N4_9PEZI|nr:unnamed protein product [Parascedosporium putredinis]CAI7992977.1 unnamed protein product [Parascedosporium putredinis]